MILHRSPSKMLLHGYGGFLKSSSSPDRSRSPEDIFIKEERDIYIKEERSESTDDNDDADCVPLDLSVNGGGRLSPSLRDSGTESDDSGGRCSPGDGECKPYKKPKKSFEKRYCKSCMYLREMFYLKENLFKC